MNLLSACKLAYRKHHLNDDSIGWDELANSLRDALCNEMGDDTFQKWLQSQSSRPNEAELYEKHYDELRYMAKGLRSLIKSDIPIEGPGSITCDRAGPVTLEDCKTCFGTGGCTYGKTKAEIDAHNQKTLQQSPP